MRPAQTVRRFQRVKIEKSYSNHLRSWIIAPSSGVRFLRIAAICLKSSTPSPSHKQDSRSHSRPKTSSQISFTICASSRRSERKPSRFITAMRRNRVRRQSPCRPRLIAILLLHFSSTPSRTRCSSQNQRSLCQWLTWRSALPTNRKYQREARSRRPPRPKFNRSKLERQMSHKSEVLLRLIGRNWTVALSRRKTFHLLSTRL